MDNSDQMKEIELLKIQVEELKRDMKELQGDAINVQKTESIFAFLFKSINLDFLKSLFSKIPEPYQIRKKINPGFIEDHQKDLKNLAIELLKNLPAIQLANLKKYRKIDFDLPDDLKFKKQELGQILDQQTILMNKMIEEGKKRMKEELKNKPQIGRRRPPRPH